MGPWFLLFGLSLMLLKVDPGSFLLLFAVWVGLFCTMRFKTTGLFVALLLLASSLILKLPHFSFWELAVTLTMGLSLFVALFSFHEAKRLFRSLEEDRTTQQQNIIHLNVLLKSAQVFALQEKKEAHKEIEAMRRQLQEKTLENNTQEKIEKLKKEVFTLATTFKTFKETPSLEFKENSSMLHQTRKELFQLVGKFLTFQEEGELGDLELTLVEHVKDLEGECNSFEEEILSKLISKKRKPPAKKNSKAAF